MEIWDAYYADGTKAPGELVRDAPIPAGLYHLVADVLVRHADGDYLLMQRDPRKPAYGGRFEATAGGSALRGEDDLTCARRELREETGIAQGSFTPIGRYVEADTIYHSFLCETQCDKSAVTLQAGETVAFRWVSEAEFIAFVNSPEMIERQRLRYDAFLRRMGYVRG